MLALRHGRRSEEREGEPGVETWLDGSWRIGVGANPWAPLSADLERGLIFVPTSTASTPSESPLLTALRYRS